jgi:cytochrome c oxidase assembly protein subunit 15
MLGVVALAAIVVTGGAVRVTGSGLGCSTWPQCEPGSYTSAIAFHPLVEFGNRMVTVLVGALTGLIAVGSLVLRPRRRDLVLLSWGLVAGYVAQAVLGGLTVLFKLSPLLVMGHFLVSILLLWMWSCCTGGPAVAARAFGRPRSDPSCGGWVGYWWAPVG